LHATYLKNQTSKKALNGHTPYKVINGHPPDLNGLPEWGCKVWVHTTASGKVGSCASEGCWVGYNDSSTMHQVYWPDKCLVSVERNVRFLTTYEATPLNNDIVLKGEESEPTTSTEPTTRLATQPSTTVPTPAPTPEPEKYPTCNCKPSQYVRDIQSRKGSAQGNNQPLMPHGIQISEATIEASEGENVKDQGELMEEIPGVVMAAKMAEVHGMDLRNLEEAK
jgi:hypothetical protein